MIATLLWLGLAASLLGVAALEWSILHPQRRLWPPWRDGDARPGLVAWAVTLVIFGSALGLGLLQWGMVALPHWLRFGIGPLLIVLGNIAVWTCVAGFGMAQTSGADGPLHTAGLYAWSRHPQYVADMAILIGWALLSAAPGAMLIAAGDLPYRCWRPGRKNHGLPRDTPKTGPPTRQQHRDFCNQSKDLEHGARPPSSRRPR